MIKDIYTNGFKIKENYILFNTLYGTLDLVDEKIYNKVMSNELLKLDDDVLKSLIDRKYINSEKNDSVVHYLLDKYNSQKTIDGKFYLIYSYLCNFKCPYCFEQNIDQNIDPNNIMNFEKLEKAFEAIKFIIHKYNLENNEINFYGGEPLLIINKDFIRKTLLFSKQNNIKVSFITNGSTINLYLDLIKEFKDIINTFSITIDGPQEIHDSRRIYKNGEGSYNDLVNSINLLKSENINVSIRVNMDLNNNFSYVEFFKGLYNDLNDFSIPVNLFRVEDNRCSLGLENTLQLSDFVSILYECEKEGLLDSYNINSCVKQYNQIKSILKSEDMIYPLFNYCHSGQLFTIDPSGNIYACPQSVGDHDFVVGKYYPTIEINDNFQKKLLNRNILEVNNCKDCSIAPLCGTGCPYKEIKVRNNTDSNKCNFEEINEMIKKYIDINYL